MQRINRKRNIRNLFAAPKATKKDLTKNTRISAEQQKQMHKLQLAAECDGDGDGNSDAGWGRQVKGADETRLCLCHCMSALPACLPTPTKGSYKFATPSSISLLCVCVCGMGKCGTWNVPTRVWETNWEWVCSPSRCLSLSVFHTALAGKWKHSTQIIKEKRS